MSAAGDRVICRPHDRLKTRSDLFEAGDLRWFVTVSFVEDLLVTPSLLAAYASAFGPDDDATLVYAVGRDEGQLRAALGEIVRGSQLGDEELPDLVGLADHDHSFGVAVRRGAHAVLSPGRPPGFDDVPRFGGSEAEALHSSPRLSGRSQALRCGEPTRSMRVSSTGRHPATTTRRSPTPRNWLANHVARRSGRQSRRFRSAWTSGRRGRSRCAPMCSRARTGWSSPSAPRTQPSTSRPTTSTQPWMGGYSRPSCATCARSG